ncbi:ATP-binding cassette domain-containing protein [Kitasatospora sp. NPDC003701]
MVEQRQQELDPAGEPPDDAAEEARWSYRTDRIVQATAKLSAWAMMRRLPQLVRRTLNLAWRVDRRATAALLAGQLVSGVLAAVALWATTGAIGAMIAPAGGPVADRLGATAWPVTVLALAAAGRALLGTASVAISERLSPRIAREAELELLAVSVAAELEAYDHVGYAERWDAADRGADSSQELLGVAQEIIASVVTLAAAAGVLAALHPVLVPFLVLASIPQGVVAARAARVRYLMAIESMDDRRLLAMLRYCLCHDDNADQIRSDTMAGFLTAKYRKAGNRLDAATDRAARRAARISLLGSLATGLASVLVWGALVALLATGHVSVAAAGTAVFALRTAGSGLQGIVGGGTRLYRLGLYLRDFDDFVAEAGGHAMRRGAAEPAAPRRVEARKVSYTYPGADRPTLDGLDLELRQGEIVALIGENGSGKSTLLRLLSGLTLPSCGVVTWDDVPTQEMDPHSLWKRVALVPQQFSRWPLTLGENIHLGHLDRAGGQELVERAAALAGADEVAATLRSRYNTLLARAFWGGEWLSGGQFQRVAVARAFHRSLRAPGLLVLDEPTSDLDPRAEHRIFHNLRTLAAGRATILVTHNLDNAVLADRIVVMRGGRIAEDGTFAELASGNGLFRELLDLKHDRDRRLPGQRR